MPTKGFRGSRTVDKLLGRTFRTPPDRAAVTEAGLLVDAGLAPDDAVRRWLATAAVPARGDIRAARLLRDQIHEVQRTLPSLTDPVVAAELRRWVAVKPNLLAD